MRFKFATCLNCIDGRVQLPAINWIKENYGVDYVDMITDPGMDGILVDESHPIENILKKVDVSIKKHNSSFLFIVGRHDCAGNPVDCETHKLQIARAAERIKYLRPAISIIGLWVTDKWQVDKLIEKQGSLE